jgi:hypothetical protein
MAVSYPSGIDNFTNPTASDTLDSATVPHATQHANHNDAIEAIENELGILPKGNYSSVKARLDGTTAQFVSVGGTAVSLSSATGNQSIFAKSFTAAAATMYLFEGFIYLATGTTSHTVSFNFGGTATYTSAAFYAEFLNVAAAGTPTSSVSTFWTANTGGVISPASTVASKAFWVKGALRINGAGTVIPQLAFSAAPGGTNQTSINSYFAMTPIGSNTFASIGSWA